MKTTFAATLFATVLAGVLAGPALSIAQDLAPEVRVENKPVFPSPIQWAGERLPAAAESGELLNALSAFDSGSETEGIAALEGFLAARPQSAWAPSLHVHLAEYHRNRGRLTLALAHWEEAWVVTRTASDGRGQGIAARAAAGWGAMLAGLGDRDKLKGLLEEVDALRLPLGVNGTLVAANRARLRTMTSRPGDAYRCGLYALNDMARTLRLDGLLRRRIFQTPAPDDGFTVSGLLELGRANGIGLEAVRRPAGADLVVPSVVHWKLDHYAAVMEKRGDLYRVVDPVVGGEVWMGLEAVDAEASGVFLVGRSKAPPSWPRLTTGEADRIHGKGYPNAIPDAEDSPPDNWDSGDDEDSNCEPPAANDGAVGGSAPCGTGSSDDSGGYLPGNLPYPSFSPFGTQPEDVFGSGTTARGMPQWRVSEPYMTVWLHDTPLAYHVSSGQWMQLKLSYKHRGESRGSWVGGFGPKWECNWLGLLVRQGPASDYATNHQAGGGTKPFRVDGTLEYSSARQLGDTQWLPPLITPPLSPTNYFYPTNGPLYSPAIRSATGSGNGYGYRVVYPTGVTNFFLTHRVDRYGRALVFNYETVGALVRLKSVLDIDGRTNTLSYTNTTFTNLITAVTDPYGRTARFTYDNLGRLTNIVDMAGMGSSFQYDSSDIITNLTTPYGQTAFQVYEGTSPTYNSENRSLLVTEPGGTRQLYAYCDSGPVATAGDNSSWAAYRNSYHWNRAQYEAISEAGKASPLDLPEADYRKAGTKHWLHGPQTDLGVLTVSDTLSSMAPAVDPTLPYPYRSPIITFDYQSDPPLKRVTRVNSTVAGTILDISRNSLGRPVVLTFYNAGMPSSYTNVFDATGRRLLRVLGPQGELVRGYGYHPVLQNLLVSVTNAVGDVIRYTHHTNTLKVAGVTFPGGLVRTNTYYDSEPGRGFLRTTIDVGFRTNSFSYQNGNVLVATNELGLVTTNTWDNLGRLVQTAFPDGTTVSNRFDKLDLVGAKDRLGLWTHYGYNAVRQLTAVTNAAGQLTTYDYCGCGGPSLATRWLGTNALVAQFNYDIVGRLTNTTYADGYQLNRTYNPDSGLLTGLSDSGGRELQLAYTLIALQYRLTSADLVSGGDTRRLVYQAYDDYANVLTSMTRNGVVVTNGYDVLRRLTARQAFGSSGQAVSGLESFAYTARGLTNYTDPLGESTVYARDAAGQLLSQTNANLEVLRFTYTPDGQLASLTDGKNQTTRWNYNLYGLATNKVDAASTEIFRYRYDAAGRLTNRWTAAKGDTGYRYDLAGNLTNIAYPAWTNVFQYDGLNRLVGMQDRVGSTSFAWTDGDQLAAEDGPWASDTVSYSYSHRLRSGSSLAQPNASAWVQGYGYDDYGRLTSVVSPAGTFGYEYAVIYTVYGTPAADLVARLDLPSGAFVRNTHDGLGRLTARELDLPDWTPIDQLGYGYNEGSQRTQQVFTAGNYVNYTYDPIGQLQSARGYESGGAARLHERFGYGYDGAWNLAYRTNNALVQTFGVNAVNELTTVSRTGTLTVAGTATERKAPSEWESGVTNVTVNAQAATLYGDATFAREGFSLTDGNNTFTAIAKDSYGRQDTNVVTAWLPASASYVYDLNGNLLSDGKRSFEYDDENQLVRVTVTNAWKSEFGYDGLMRRRVRKEYTWSGGGWVQTNEVRYVYGRKLVLQERDANNIGKVVYTRGRDLSGTLEEAGGIGGLLARTDQSTLDPQLSTAYYHSDANGNVVCLINRSNAVVARYQYDPYGNILSQSGPLAEVNLCRFSSKEVHPNSGLVYYLYRYYEPGLQRWVNRDPIQEWGGLHLYAYLRNNPANGFDSFGKCDSAWLKDAARMTGEPQRSILALEATIDNGAYALSYRFPVTVEGNVAIRAVIQENMGVAQERLIETRAAAAGGAGVTASTVLTIGGMPAGGVLSGAAGSSALALGWTGIGLSLTGGVALGIVAGEYEWISGGGSLDENIQEAVFAPFWDWWYGNCDE